MNVVKYYPTNRKYYYTGTRKYLNESTLLSLYLKKESLQIFHHGNGKDITKEIIAKAIYNQAILQNNKKVIDFIVKLGVKQFKNTEIKRGSTQRNLLKGFTKAQHSSILQLPANSRIE